MLTHYVFKIDDSLAYSEHIFFLLEGKALATHLSFTEPDKTSPKWHLIDLL